VIFDAGYYRNKSYRDYDPVFMDAPGWQMLAPGDERKLLFKGE